jgi:hypothetical protein
MQLAKIEIENEGLFIDHNFPCPCCGKHSAILGEGHFNPCYSCQAEGLNIVNLVKSRPWWVPLWLWEKHFGVNTISATRNNRFFYKEETVR